MELSINNKPDDYQSPHLLRDMVKEKMMESVLIKGRKQTASQSRPIKDARRLMIRNDKP